MLPHRQHGFMCSNNLEGFRMPSVIRALYRKDLMVECDNFRTFTDKGRDYVRRHKQHELRVRLASGIPDAPVIETDDALEDYLFEDGARRLPVRRVVVGGDFPPRVMEIAGREPLAYLHPYYLWEIEREKSAGQFLERTDLLMYDLAYHYEVPREDPAAAPTP
ncbi:hypothetical protein Salmuc_03456 [Salipiger mucosus DSM 16094]|uniref:Uncharacterized protein n=2 Tax=Salipiger mucosus TaxID=263378 RepID=S9RJ38_9RHOB|nr:hypothetical protein Salmuc_03456 [Salipiger mucosus DSM 16094]